MNIYERRNSVLGMEFDRYIREHPQFAERIPDNAHIALLLEETRSSTSGALVWQNGRQRKTSR